MASYHLMGVGLQLNKMEGVFEMNNDDDRIAV